MCVHLFACTKEIKQKGENDLNNNNNNNTKNYYYYYYIVLLIISKSISISIFYFIQNLNYK